MVTVSPYFLGPPAMIRTYGVLLGHGEVVFVGTAHSPSFVLYNLAPPSRWTTVKRAITKASWRIAAASRIFPLDMKLYLIFQRAASVEEES